MQSVDDHETPKDSPENDKDKLFQCTECGEEFSRISALKTHRANKKKKHKCEECGSVFALSTTLQTHRLTHLEENPFKCHICPKQFTQGLNLRKHINKYESEEEHQEKEARQLQAKQFACDECHKNLSSERVLRLHKVSIPSDNRPYECDQCDKSFSQIGKLNFHSKRVHQVDQSFEQN